MVTVVCKVSCGYQVGGLCTRSVVPITKQGQCAVWWREDGIAKAPPYVAEVEENFSNRRTIKVEDLEIEENQMENQSEN